jgi:Fe-S cluster biogenesis protein NfuA
MTLVPMHPEATSDPQIVRWVIPDGVLPVVGEIAEPPPELAAMLDSGDIASIQVQTRAVVVRLAAGRSWSELGAHVRAALGAALQQPHQWQPTTPSTEADRLRSALEDVLAGPAGDYIHSHGGDVTILAVKDGRAEVRLNGACEHCPAAGLTLHARLERELRARFPDLVELRADQHCHGATRPTWLTLGRKGT